MRKIAIINQKGGSGKTTTTVNLAASLTEKRRRVLIIDADPQGSTSSWLEAKDDQGGLYGVLTQNVPIEKAIMHTGFTGIEIIPASPWLMGVERFLAQEVGAEMVLKHKLADFISNNYHYLLIDCPPTLGLLTVNALVAVQEVIVPVEARVMALNGLVQLLNTIDIIKQRLNPELNIAGIVPCRVDVRTKHSLDVVGALRSNFASLIYKSAIHENIRLSESPSFCQPITYYDSMSKGAADYRSLAKEVISQEK